MRWLVGIVLLSVVLVIVTAFRSTMKAQTPTREEMQSMIAAELPVGSDARRIEAFFRRHKLYYSYDEFTDRYNSIVRYDKFSGITIQISVDRNKKEKSANVEGYTTAP